MKYSVGMALSDFDARLLDFAQHAPRALGAREEAIRARLGISPVRYYQRLNLLIDDPEAMAAHPALVRRLAALRERHGKL
ncbi:DUF3263 domain-containing protein [Corynebacterium sp. zg-331]|uniref:DUF3263 domain-containing protein n=1 Tax=unclassified Corynebacterium TaxID=2624378 RepID=UPI00128B3FA1|nr:MULTISPECIES: DUF3263 domain-containing protein [unclassified Corynebacterium]MBC3185735.1 DUF3263 domain-containing protein [Corynebacterium sp. zg-331]MPV52228.1 DUF3263 domain-containing protein [Corynebacterium sp. zg331]